MDPVARFKEFLRIPSISQTGHHDGSYDQAVQCLQRMAEEAGLSCRVVTIVKSNPILICQWTGSQPELPALLLNSHYDVVPVEHEKWTLAKPFDAQEIDGDIIARGTQDMKSVCIQYIEAIRRLKAKGEQPKRTILLTFVPDEELGGLNGMQKLVATKLFKDFNVGLALDEGLASEDHRYMVYYGQRTVWWLKVRAKGQAGHGSRLLDNTAVIKLHKAVSHFLDFRASQRSQLGEKQLGELTTVNMTALNAGTPIGDGDYAMNVVPSEAMAGFDMRIPPSVNLKEFEALVRTWASEDGVDLNFQLKQTAHSVSSIDPNDNPWWAAFTSACKDFDMEIVPGIFPAGTDSFFIRELGIPAFGFSPMQNTPVLLHDHNERLHRDVFLRGIELYEHIIWKLANFMSTKRARL